MKTNKTNEYSELGIVGSDCGATYMFYSAARRQDAHGTVERTARVSILFQSGNTVKLSVNEIKVRKESECATPVYRGITWRCLLIRLLSGIIV